MPRPDPIQSFQQAAHRHTFEDGINEILAGILLAAGAFMMLHRLGALPIVVALALKWALPRLRDRITAPRIGAADLPQKPWGTLRGILVYTVLAACVLVAVRLATAGSSGPLGGYRWLPVLVGIWLAGGFLYAAGKTRLKRFYLYLAASAGGGLVLTLMMTSGERQEGYAMVRTLLWGLAALLVVAGTITLITFIRRNPVFTEEGGGSREQ